jgi:putative ABC transport system permease protein
MQTLFGIPANTLAAVMLAAFAVAGSIVAIAAVRNRVFLRLGVRNVGRRRSRTVLILLGLMLGTALISAALNTGDTLAHSVRTAAIRSLGDTDELVGLKGVSAGQFGVYAVVDYFDQGTLPDVKAAADASGRVDGVAPAVIETIAVQDVTTRQTESQIGLFATDPAQMRGFGAISKSGGGDISLADLGDGELYLNATGAEKLDARAGNEMTVFAGGALQTMRVKDIVNYDGTGTDGAAILIPLAAAQKLVHKEGRINYVLISNTGGVGDTDRVVKAMEPGLTAAGLEIKPTKQDALNIADQIGNSMMITFTTFGTFSVVAGVLLIFLIFVMLAAERKAEMGVSRAVGTQRTNLVQMFLFEGVAYDLAAATIGALLGVAVAYVMVLVMAAALASFGFHLEHDLRASSMIIAYTLGVLITLIVVTVSAWQVSVLNIVRAIRNLPDPALRGSGRGSLLIGAIASIFGALLIYLGIAATQAASFHLGVSLIIIGAIPVLRALRVNERLAWSTPAAALTVWWLMPFFVTESFLPALSKDFTIFVLSGLMVVTGAIWVIMYNSDLILHGAMTIFGRIKWLAPMLKAAVAYPLSSRFRTGAALAMFTLVVFTLVVMATVITSVNGVLDDKQTFGGGYDIRATTAPISPITNLEAMIRQQPDLNAADFQNTAAGSTLALKVRQVGVSDTKYHDYLARGFDDAFMANNQFGFSLMASGYDSPRQIWQALAGHPDLAVIDAYAVPRRTNYSGGPTTIEFHLSGFYLEDKKLPPLQIEVNDPQTGATRTLTVIGVLRDTVSQEAMLGVSTSERSVLSAYGVRAQPTTHFVKLAPGVDAKGAAKSLESAFLANGMQATPIQSELNDLMATQHAFTYILEGFMGLGLIVGVCALGVISARSVVERRQEIGVLRSLGFQQGMVQIAFLLESSFISLLGIFLGIALGLVVSFNVVLDYRNTPGWETMTFTVPWLTLGIVFAVVYAGSLLATLLPARQASRVYPAQALRYE